MLRFQSTFPRGERRFLRGGSRLVSYFNPRSLVGNDVLRRAACPLLFYFNPRSLVGNDGNQNIRRNQNGNFNPRSLVGNDMGSMDRSLCLFYFNPRSLVGNDMGQIKCDLLDDISIHVPSWGTTIAYRSSMVRWIFQSTFPRGERRENVPDLSSSGMISIHVPSWGTTALLPASPLSWTISIHVPSWGTTHQFRLHIKLSEISIHVPSWGTTSLASQNTTTDSNFNPRSLVGNDLRQQLKFQVISDFNPRSLVGNDDPHGAYRIWRSISIHVPSWGTTRLHRYLCHSCAISIHVPSWGTTHLSEH